MAVDSYHPVDGHPTFTDEGATDLAVDSNAVAQFAAFVGTRAIGTTAQREAYAYARDGFRWGDRTDKKEYEWNDGWVVVGGSVITAAAPSMGANWSWGSGSKITRAGDTVTVHALLTRSSAISGAQTIFTLPVGFRPTDAVAAAGALVSGGSEGGVTVTVTAAGVVTIVYLTNTTATSMRLDFSFPAA